MASPLKGLQPLKIHHWIIMILFVVILFFEYLPCNGYSVTELRKTRNLARSVMTKVRLFKLDEIEEKVLEVVFDSYYNTYIATEKNFYKLNNQNAVKYVFPIPKPAGKIIVNKRDEAYFFSNGSLNLMQSDSIKEKYLFSFELKNSIIFIDESDNFYFNMKNGVVFLRQGQNIPLVIRNLEEFHFDIADEDEVGNVYLVDSKRKNNSLAVITKEAKSCQLPYARIDPSTNKVSALKVLRNVPLIVEHPTEIISTVKTLLHQPKDFVLAQYHYKYFFLYKKNSDRLFILEESTRHTVNDSHLHFIAPRMMNLVMVQGDYKYLEMKKKGHLHVVDTQGTAYFAYFHDKKSQVLSLRLNETYLRTVDITTEADIFDLAVDRDDNLWILADELYFLEKGSNETIQIPPKNQLKTTNGSFLKIKMETNEVYISSNNAIFVVENN